MSRTLTPEPTNCCSSAGRPTSGGKVPKCIGTTVFTPRSSTALAARLGPIVQVADGQESHIELTELSDKSHVAENICVAREVDRVTVLELDDKAHRLAAVKDLVAV